MVNIHGITASDVKGESEFDVVWEKIKSYFNGFTIVAHNAPI